MNVQNRQFFIAFENVKTPFCFGFAGLPGLTVPDHDPVNGVSVLEQVAGEAEVDLVLLGGVFISAWGGVRRRGWRRGVEGGLFFGGLAGCFVISALTTD